MPTYRTSRPSGRLTTNEKQVGKFTIQPFKESAEFGWIGYRIINDKGEAVLEVLEGSDAEFDEAVKLAQRMAREEEGQTLCERANRQ